MDGGDPTAFDRGWFGGWRGAVDAFVEGMWSVPRRRIRDLVVRVDGVVDREGKESDDARLVMWRRSELADVTIEALASSTTSATLRPALGGSSRSRPGAAVATRHR
jgi:hypothetical protein